MAKRRVSALLAIGLLASIALVFLGAGAPAAQQEKGAEGCVATAKGPLAPQAGAAPAAAAPMAPPPLQTARVGKPAPDFEAIAYIDGGFKPVTLSAYKGKWVVLCFYPGDFTFV
jgi:peroxiredoxin (alkyl hydroperoxide reductase subunit C)